MINCLHRGDCSFKGSEVKSVLPPDNGSLQFRLGVVHNVLQNPPQRNWDGQKDKDAGYEPSFTVGPNLRGWEVGQTET